MLSVSVSRQKREILIVEDDGDLREAISAVLVAEGYGVRMAAHGREALDDLRGRPRPCLILLDLMMPVMNGWEFLKVLRTDETIPDVCVIVTSAAPSGDLSDATDVLRKPFNLDGLLTLVRQHCHP
jgi:two-component system chemotaxis response regulator CheY